MKKNNKDNLALKMITCSVCTTLISTTLLSCLTTPHWEQECVLNKIIPNHQTKYLQKYGYEPLEIRVIKTEVTDKVPAEILDDEEEIYLYANIMGYTYNSKTGNYEKHEVYADDYSEHLYTMVPNEDIIFVDSEGNKCIYDYNAGEIENYKVRKISFFN